MRPSVLHLALEVAQLFLQATEWAQLRTLALVALVVALAVLLRT